LTTGGRAENVRVPTLTRGTAGNSEAARVNDLRPSRPSAAEIELTIDLTADPIEGLLRHPHGADKPFAGWMALIRAVELALEDERRHREL
jgi:hypothetical protein